MPKKKKPQVDPDQVEDLVEEETPQSRVPAKAPRAYVSFNSPEEARQALGANTKWRWDIVKFDEARRSKKCHPPTYSFDFDEDAQAARHGPGEYRRSLRATNRAIGADELYGEDFFITEEQAAAARARLPQATPAAPGDGVQLSQFTAILDAKMSQLRAELAPRQSSSDSTLVEAIKALGPVLRPPETRQGEFGTKDMLALIVPLIQNRTPMS